MKKVAIIISPNWKDYAKKYLSACVKSIWQQDYPGEMKIFLTDNETSPESFRYLSETVPEAELILNKYNDGFAKGNNDAMRLALSQGFDYIVLFNMDTEIESSCVSELVKVLGNDKSSEDGKNLIGAVQPRIMLYSDRNKINSLGNSTHFLGFGYCESYRQEYTEQNAPIHDIAYFSGAGIMFRAEVLKEIGLFDEEYWMYNEDQELGWRLWLAGFRCVLAPSAVLYHKYEFAKSIKQFYYLDRNRILAILECYHPLTLILIFPAFVAMEIGLILFSLKSGWFKEKMKVWQYFLKISSWIYIVRARRRNQALRKVKDRYIIPLISGRIWYQETDDWKLRFINPIFEFYWKIVRKLIVW